MYDAPRRWLQTFVERFAQLTESTVPSRVIVPYGLYVTQTEIKKARHKEARTTCQLISDKKLFSRPRVGSRGVVTTP